jgi:integrase
MKKNIRSFEDSVWVVQIYEENAVEKKRFETETAAVSWAANFAKEVNTKAGSDFHDLTFLDLMNRYLDEVSIKTVKHPKNVLMIKFFTNAKVQDRNEFRFPIMKIKLQDLCKQDFANFRDVRLKEVGDGTFKRDWYRFYNAMEIASGEWGWIHRNIMKGVRVPKEPVHRCRRITPDEELSIREYLLAKEEVTTSKRNHHFQTAIIFQLAIETGLRMSEILALKRHEIFLIERYLQVTGIEPNAKKTHSSIRSVPLTAMAQSLLRDAISREWNSEFVFSLKQPTLTLIFREACKTLEIKDLNFHDTRHEATSRLAQIYQVLDLAKIIGHKDVQTLLVYYQPTIDELVAKMNIHNN